MFDFEYTEFHLPNGRQTIEKVSLDDDYKSYVEYLTENGFIPEYEVLRNGLVSMTFSDGERDVAIEICENDAVQIKDHWQKMISRLVEKVKYGATS